MNDIRPPKKRLPSTVVPQLAPLPPTPLLPAIAEPDVPASSSSNRPASGGRKRNTLRWIICGLLAVVVAAVIGAFVWYTLSLRAVSTQDSSRTRVQIVAGSTPADIAQLLKSSHLIRSQLAFNVYTRLSGERSHLQAGIYSLSPSESTEEIVNHLVAGKVDQFNITFLPGATLAQDRTQLLQAGYTAADVDAALSKIYNLPLFADKPTTADLEGYIYGDTYNFDSTATVEQILTKTFDEYDTVIQNNSLVDGFKKQGLTLYQGITLASIIQREVPNASDQKIVAQIFLKRLSSNMPLGSDVTYIYAANKLGVAPSPDLNSPYNTRINTGLPPGPIATPGLTALQAVANPASTDYLYFLSGDDNVTYYASTEAEHEANIAEHCKIKCAAT
jgi:UPF0755 protein